MFASHTFARTLIAGAAVMAASSAWAYEFNALNQLASQAEFKQVAQDLSATLAYKPQAPADSLGVIGFDLGLSVAATTVKSKDVLKRATGSDNVPGALPSVTLRAEKGLPLGFDVGVSYGVIPGTSASAFSGALKWAFVSGGLVTPSLATRVFFTETNGLGDMGLRSQGVDVSISKGFAIVTPYAGVGIVRSRASTKSNVWAKESYTQTRVFAGANVNLLVMDLSVEADKTGDDTTVGVKAGFRF